ncbi:aminotransferase [Clavulina sp. PMI_390]|nr:aminotransferase [Clavulina sp. PMI_390]
MDKTAHLPPLSIAVQAHAGEIGSLPDIDPSKLIIQPAATLKPVPAAETLIFGQTMTDHMLEMDFDPESGWSAPVIKPYAALTLEPCSSIFHYTPALFEGMKAFVGPDGKARLFRPNLNMQRMARSTDRAALPDFDAHALLELIKELVRVEKRWIPTRPGYSLYIRPTLIGTRASIGVSASTHAKLFVIVTPSGPYWPTGFKPLALFAETDSVRSWPGGTGAYKLGINYTPTFRPQREAAKLGYQQILWILKGEKDEAGNYEEIVTEAGAMNFFAVVRRTDGALDLITPPLDGTILPGVTRTSILDLCAHINESSSPLRQFITFPPLVSSPAITDTATAEKEKAAAALVSPPPSTRSSPSSSTPVLPPTEVPEPSSSAAPSELAQLHPREAKITIADLERWAASGALLEAFGSGTAVVIAPVKRIGIYRPKGASANEEREVRDIVLPEYEGGLGPVAGVMYRSLAAVYEGRAQVGGWSVEC